MSLRFIFLTVLVLCSFSCNKKEDKSSKLLHSLDNRFQKSVYNNLSAVEKLKLIDTVLGDSLLGLNHKDSLYFVLLFRKSNLHFNLKQIDSSNYYDKLLLSETKEANNSFYKARANRNLGFYYSDIDKPDSAFYHLNLAIKDFKVLKDSIQVAKRLQNLAVIKANQNDFFGSNNLIVEQLKYLEESDSINIPRALDMLASNYRDLKNYGEAIKNHDLSISMTKDSSDRLAFLNNLSIVYQKQNKYNAAAILQKKLLKIAKRDSNLKRVALLSNLLAYSQMQNEESGVLELLDSSLLLKKKLGMTQKFIPSYMNFGKYYQKKQQWSKARKYFDSARIIARELRIPKTELAVLKEIVNLKSQDLYVRDRYIRLKDSIYESEYSLQSKFAKMEYEDQQEKDRILALEAKTSKQESQLAQQRAQKIFFVSLLGLMIIGGVFYLNVSKQKHLREKLQEVYKTEKRISQDLHNNLSNDLFGLMTNIQNHKSINEEILDHLDNIYRTTREISHKNSAIATGSEFKGELLRLINTYQDKQTTIVTKGINDIDWSNLADDKCITLHRSMKELLVNLKKHAQASLVSIQFQKTPQGIRVTYFDNGIGFSKNDISNGVGLDHINSRIQDLGGKFRIHHNIESGSKIEIMLV